MALHIARTLIAHGKVERGWLGVTVQDLTSELAKAFHIEFSKGALITDVVEGSPAYKAGLKKGDVVIVYQGKEIPDAGTLRNEVAVTPINHETKLIIVRDGKKEEITVTIGNLNEAAKMLASSAKERLGVSVQPITQKEAEKYGLESKQGVRITSIEPKGPLGRAGFEVGDIILAINGNPVEGVESFVDLVSSIRPRQQITVLVLDHRTGDTGEIQVEVR